ncbi:phospholipase C/P1 nuclease domain-containing protein [Mycena albidolilacea]|uniref:Phospholipase C/P1 nuclease domain-containing protein n=1 Tax=Mycena albidolilacea TaxID=1033008 RepID=A0AAD7ACL7_9AGAR|nr:phospholipase C/P1 nuclease domain-containing protein [Mycena albidolilacea]
MFPKIPVLCALAGLTTSAVAWGAAGHEIVATIAQIHLHPSVFPTMCAILNFTSPCHLAPIATWADTERSKMPWSGPLHYVGAVDDYPSQTCVFPGPRGWAGKDGANVLGGIRNVTDILTDWVYFNKGGAISGYQYDTANEALKFLVHFLGDMHMPLHLTGRDRGGNLIPVFFDGRKTNLHSLWDDLLIAKALRSVPDQYSRPLPSLKIEQALRGTIYDSYVRMIMWEGVLDEWEQQIPDWLSCPVPFPSQSACVSNFDAEALAASNRIGGTDDRVVCPYQWAKPIHALNCEIVWPTALDQPPYNDTRPPGAMGEQEFFSFDEDSVPFVELDTPQYSGVISEQRIVEKLLAQAGLRLAGVINYLFAELEGDEQHLSV